MKILLVDDEPNILDSVGGALERCGYEVICASGYEKAMEKCDKTIEVALLDVWLSEGDGVELLKKFKDKFPELVAVMISGHSTIATAVEAIKHGAYDFLEKPLSLDRLEVLLQNIDGFLSLKKQRDELLSLLEGEYNLIGQSSAIERLRQTILRFAPEQAPVLVTGESGTGKELVARQLHGNSPRKNAPFVAINCAALPDELSEAELFGFEKGAFTGAMRSHEGHFRRASSGVIFLDEISEMSLRLQAKLLRVIEEKEVTPLGSRNTFEIDVRIVAASNRNLKAESENGSFRQDLYFRLNVLPVDVPPLRERIGDIKILAEYFCGQYAKKSNKKLRTISAKGIAFLENLKYPGNVRELKNYIERILIVSDNDVIDVDDIKKVLSSIDETGFNSLSTLKQAVEDFEKAFIEKAIEGAGDNMARAARVLGLERSHLYKKMKALGIERNGH
ncbi:MAG: sigma-54-dependent Fis family transcriptional regulator [candidate division Zixibacteria bacterium]|nr:sigma-54-dependent Fis family transcriptional regulator [candidate division Zixibacteria bacterium]